MELKTFVAESLKQIAEGIKEAQQADTGAWIAPRTVRHDDGTEIINTSKNALIPQKIKFDIAISVSEEGSGTGGGKHKGAVVQYGWGCKKYQSKFKCVSDSV